MKIRWLSPLAVTAVVALSFGPIGPAASAPLAKFSAVAFAPSVLGAGESVPVGYATGSSRAEARSGALSACKKDSAEDPSYRKDCRHAAWVENGFMALRYINKTDGAWGSGWGKTWEEAGKQADKVCKKRNHGADCNQPEARILYYRTPYYSADEETKGGA